MTDREILEAAALAAGWKWWRSKHGYINLTSPDGEEYVCCQGWNKFDPNTGVQLPEPTLYDALIDANWSPMTDPGDALRLAVALKMYINVDTSDIFACGEGGAVMREFKGTDPIAATCRVITRAAAEIGRAKT